MSRSFVRALGALAVASIVVVAPLPFAGAQSASADVFDASGVALKFKQANRSAITTGATGKTAGDILKYANVVTINGVTIDAAVKTVSVVGGTITKIDEGTAVSSPSPGSPQTVDDLLLTDLVGSSSTEASVELEFSFYEGGTYTGPGSGVPATLTNVSINSYDIDANAGAKQFTDFSGFQSYKTYSASSTQGLDLQDKGNGLVRFITRDANTNVQSNSGSYSFARVQVNYDQVTTLRARVGELGPQQAYFALDFSAGGIWTTNGSTEVFPTLASNPYNVPPTTADIVGLYAAKDSGYVFRTVDFPYADAERNPIDGLTIRSLPADADALQYKDGTEWVPVTANQVLSISALDAGRLRLVPTTSSGSFTFTVNDGLADSAPSTLTYLSAVNPQTISFATPTNQAPSSTFPSAATASSGLVPVLTSETPGVCTVSGLNITALALPTGATSALCVVTATQNGDSAFGRAAAVTQQFTIQNPLPQTITFTNPGDTVFSTSAIPTDAATSASSRSVTLTSSTPTICTVTGTSIVPVALGTCTVEATSAGNGAYLAATPVSRTFEITPIAQTVTFPQPPTQSIATGSLTTDAMSSASDVTALLTSSTPLVCTVTGLSVSFIAPGECTITASSAADATHSAATSVVRTFRILRVASAVVPDGQAGTLFTLALAEDGGSGSGTWSTTSLPAGLTLDAATGVLSGTPTASFDGVFTATYTEDGASHARTFNLRILAVAPPAITEPTAPVPAPSTAAPVPDPSTTAPVPAPTTAGVTPPAAATPAPSAEAAEASGLASTGTDPALPLGIAAALLLLGAALVLRRFRSVRETPGR